ncbi:MAG TPA: tetraprenyl-beta-curcumene synthase family protein [Chondromyces sp.]|nr:tetraprenyl-beta-curcumene synthase family protein [Chondromyces sp.]
MSIPSSPLLLMHQVYKYVFPIVHEQLGYWKQRAEEIPDDELRTQALASIKTKTFHCEGGAILALLSPRRLKSAVRFIVAYQTISDYLDNLCDRSTSLDPKDFAALHEAMKDAVVRAAPERNYYRWRSEQEDGGYLQELVYTCQSVLHEIKEWEAISPFLKELCQYYCDLQIHKHVKLEEREERLKNWFSKHQQALPPMEWYEFSACSGSTLGIFCLVCYSLRNDFRTEYAEKIREGYFPYIQGLHILLDYLIDQEEDREGGDLNFCFYYDNEAQIFERLIHFLEKADTCTAGLPNRKFHMLINRGLLGVYLSDDKVAKQKHVHILAKKIIRKGGMASYFFYVNGRAYRKMKQVFPKFFEKREGKAEPSRMIS